MKSLPCWINNILNKASPFWINVFNTWKEFCPKQQPTSNTDVIYSSLWFNGHISKEPLFFPNWAKQGIFIVGDVIDEEGKIKSRIDLMRQYNFNILNYFRLQSLLQVFISKFSNGDNFKFQRPFIPSHVKYLIKAQGSKEIYNHMTIMEKTNLEDVKLSGV